MSVKTDAVVVIDGKVYTLSGYEDADYLQRVGTYINGKIAEIDAVEQYRHMPMDMRHAFVEINLADDFFKAKAQVEKLERDLANKEKEVYDLKHDLISNQIMEESSEERIKQLEAENKELLLNKARLEASLEDSLFHKRESGISGTKDEI